MYERGGGGGGGQNLGWYFVHGQDDLNLHIFYMLEGTFFAFSRPIP